MARRSERTTIVHIIVEPENHEVVGAMLYGWREWWRRDDETPADFEARWTAEVEAMETSDGAQF